MIPNDPFLNENKPLPPGVELQLSFDRLKADYSICKVGQADPQAGKVLKLKNVFAQVEYISSPIMRNYMDKIDTSPLVYKYDEISVMYKTLVTGEQSIRLENLKGGNTPDYLFIGIMPTTAMNGTVSESSTRFRNYGIKEINLTLNGASCQGYPMRINNDQPVVPYFKFHETLGKIQNSSLAGQLSMDKFCRHTIFAHKFEGEESTQG